MANAPLSLTRRGRLVVNTLTAAGIALGFISLVALATMFGGR